MLAYLTYDLSTVLLLMILGVAVYTDLQRHRIPNVLTLLALVAGLALQGWFLELSGVGLALLGAVVGLMLFLPLYLLGGMGAGDVKLLAVVGCFVGPISVLLAACFTILAGTLFSLGLLMAKGELSRVLYRYLAIVTSRHYIAPQPGDVAAQRLPFAAAIATGTSVELWRLGDLSFYHLINQLNA